MNLGNKQKAAGDLAKNNKEEIMYVGAVNLIFLTLLYIPTSKLNIMEFGHKELLKMDPMELQYASAQMIYLRKTEKKYQKICLNRMENKRDCKKKLN